MNILLVANYEPDCQISMSAFTRMLERELPQVGCTVRAIRADPIVLRVGRTSRMWKWLGYIDKFVLFIPRLRRSVRWADIVHICDHSNGMYAPWVRLKPTVITCHDVIAIQAARGMVPKWNVGMTGKLFQHLIANGLARVDKVACVSELTRRDLLAIKVAEESRVTTVHNGLNADFTPTPLGEARARLSRFGAWSQRSFLLHIGSDLPRKNRKSVLQTFIALCGRAKRSGLAGQVENLVLIGPGLSDEMRGLVDSHGIAERVHTIQGLDHADLCAAYSAATALLFPSLQEGFGWPVIEAQAAGCPVFTSNRPPMNEIGGDGAVYIDPEDPEAIATAFEGSVPDFETLRARGLRNARRYSSREMALHYVAVYKEVLAARPAE